MQNIPQLSILKNLNKELSIKTFDIILFVFEIAGNDVIADICQIFGLIIITKTLLETVR